MSSYNKLTKHPTTGKWEEAFWIDDKFGSHCYGVEFPSTPGAYYNPDIVKLETKEREEQVSTFKLGDKVRKHSGYGFVGVIVARFQTTKGDHRYVVESTVAGSEGWLMIFNSNQLELQNG